MQKLESHVLMNRMGSTMGVHVMWKNLRSSRDHTAAGAKEELYRMSKRRENVHEQTKETKVKVARETKQRNAGVTVVASYHNPLHKHNIRHGSELVFPDQSLHHSHTPIPLADIHSDDIRQPNPPSNQFQYLGPNCPGKLASLSE